MTGKQNGRRVTAAAKIALGLTLAGAGVLASCGVANAATGVSSHRADSSAVQQVSTQSIGHAAPIELVEVPGRHMSMLEEPHVAELAEALRTAMDPDRAGSDADD